MSVSFSLTSHSSASSIDKLEVVAVAATEAMSGLNNKDFSQRLSCLLPTTSTSPASSRNQPSVTKTATFPRRIRQPLGGSFPWRRTHTHTHTHICVHPGNLFFFTSPFSIVFSKDRS